MNESRNPYAPPKADVGTGDVSVRPPRPPAVRIALALMAVVIVMSALQVISLVRPMSEAMISGLTFLLQVAVLAFYVWVFVAIARGRNWARILLLLFTLFGVVKMAFHLWGWLALPDGVHMTLDRMALAVAVFPILLNVVACTLLLGPARRWFKYLD